LAEQRILVLGRNGQVGHELARMPWPTGLRPRLMDRAECDLADPARIADAVRRTRPDLVVNAAAYTAVDRAEEERETAYAINQLGPRHLAEACAATGAALIHLSTDYVFDGAKPAPYEESDRVAPIGAYGASKEAGETAIRAALPRHVILRTSWVFGAHGHNFVKSILRLAKTNLTLRVVADQIGGPTAARDIASAVIGIADALSSGAGAWGTFHYAGQPATTWHGFATTILRLAGRQATIEPIATADYPTAARRPANSRLDCRRILDAYGIIQPAWETGLSAVLAELGELAS
jgi:dTDP-4-dehydrorhamnose reductase